MIVKIEENANFCTVTYRDDYLGTSRNEICSLGCKNFHCVKRCMKYYKDIFCAAGNSLTKNTGDPINLVFE